ncbi:MAG TPA: TetR/AcrR family transcriptional regulator [Terriglobales bacterium]|nr:TetR/AcrR family transcriptional regulator [Terriglobales bacterium]
MTLQGKTRRQALTEFREAEILEAARQVFGEHGYAAATVDLIAAAAGVAKGTLYLYYPSKDEIFWAALSSRFREMLDRTRREMEAAVGARAKIRAALRVRFDFLRSDEQFVRMYVTEFGAMCRAPGGCMRALYQEAVECIAAALAEGVRSGELRPLDTLEAAMALLELVKGVFAMRFTGMPGQNPGFDGEKFVFDLYWNGVAARAPEEKGEEQVHA